MRVDPVMRAALVLALAGCAASTDLGVIQHPFGHDLGGSLQGHFGMGAIQKQMLVIEGTARFDVGDANSRVAFGAGAFGGLPVGDFRAFARAGIWHAVASSTNEGTIVPTVEVGAFIPLRSDPIDSQSKYGWAASGVVVGIREDFDAIDYTTIFVGLQLLMIPGY